MRLWRAPRRGAPVAALFALCAGLAGADPSVAQTAPGGAVDDLAAPKTNAAAPSLDRLEGHGGPIKGVAVSSDGRLAATASFDYALGLWDLASGARLTWLDGHEAAANAALFLPDGRLVSGGDDFALMLWDLSGDSAPLRLEGHQNKIQNLALSPMGDLIASASWDGDIGLWRLSSEGDAALEAMLDGHQSGVNDVAFSADGAALFSASTDGTVRRWDLETRSLKRIEARHGFGVNLLTLNETAEGGGWLAYGGADGIVRVQDLASGAEIALLDGERRPILAMAESPDGQRLAYGDGEGYISVVRTADWSLEREFRAVTRGPIWALAFKDDETLLAGGLDDFAAVWPIGAAEAPLFPKDAPRRFQVAADEVSNGERQFARKCSVCHTLTPDSRRRAGPTLFGVFGRRAGALSGYAYSPALLASDIVWSPETLDKLFDIGPDHYTPGSKMPMQRIVDPSDRADLISYLRAATGAAPQDP
ncbi:MAG: c-type cytochrome [Pseudomonadota bacterium]